MPLTALIFLGNVYISNITYEGSEAVYSLYLISIALFLLLHDGQRLLRLLILHLPTAPPSFKTVLTHRQQRIRAIMKICFLLLFVMWYGFSTSRVHYQRSNYRLPSTAGLPGLAGLYNVTEFHLNNRILPYSDTDTLRWQDVVFETWNTISIRTNKQVTPYPDAPERPLNIHTAGIYELAGTVGRYYYGYVADTLQQVLTLHNRHPRYAGKPLELHYVLLPPEGYCLLVPPGTRILSE